MTNDDLKIDGMDVRILRLKTVRAHTLSMATMTEQRVVLLQLKTRGGLTGYGEAATIGGLSYADESPEGIKLALSTYFAPLLLGENAADFGRLGDTINRTITGHFFAKNAVQTALLDLVGKAAGVPLATLLGGRIHESLPVAWTLASGDTARDVEEARHMLAVRRHNIFKLKIGKRPWREDVAHVAKIKSALGAAASVRVDVNQAWSLSVAKCAVPALAEAGVDLVEQPLRHHDLEGARELRHLGGAAIMADEALRGGPPTAMKLASSRACDVFALKPGQAGGLLECAQVAAIGQASGLDLYGGTMLEVGIGTVASAHLFSTLPKLEWGTELFGPLLVEADILATPLLYQDFVLKVPTGPGLGVELDVSRVEEVTESAVSLSANRTKG